MANPFSALLERFRSYVGPRQITDSDDLKDRWKRNLTPNSHVQTRLFFSHIEEAVIAADNGQLLPAGRLCSALRADGVITGALSTRYDGLLQLPRIIEGPDEEINQALREEFDTVFPAPELSLTAADGGLLGLNFGEMINEGERQLTFRRQNPEFLQYRPEWDLWQSQTRFFGLQTVRPDGHWVLHFGGGALQPWRAKTMWRALARAYISKEHAIFFRDGWNQSMAHPAKVARLSKGRTDEERRAFLDLINQWSQNAGFVITEDEAIDLLQANIQGYQTFQDTIASADNEIILTINGQTPTTTGGTAFSNTAVHAKIRSDLIQSDANTLAKMLNEQCIPVWVNERFGWGAIERSPRVRWDTTPPKDRQQEAQAALTAGQAIEAWNKALEAAGSTRRVDADREAERFGISLTDGSSTPAQIDPAGLQGSAVPFMRRLK